jgi:hypothetical protein
MVQKAELLVTLKDSATKPLKSISASTIALGNIMADVAKSGIKLLGSQLADTIKKSIDQEKVLAQMDAVLQSTGGTVGRTKDELVNFSRELQRTTGVGDELTQSGQNLLLTFTNVRGEAFDKATKSAIDMAMALNDGEINTSTLRSSTLQLGKALNDPIKGISALSRVGVSFTDQQKEQIKTLVESGDVMGAQNVILKELNKEFGGTAETLNKTLGGQIKATIGLFDDLKEEIGAGLTPVLRDEFLPVVQSAITSIANMVEPKDISNFVSSFIGGFLTITSTVKVTTAKISGFISNIKENSLDFFEIIKLKSEESLLQVTNIFGRNSRKIEKIQEQQLIVAKRIDGRRVQNSADTAQQIADENKKLAGKLVEFEQKRLENSKKANETILANTTETSEKKIEIANSETITLQEVLEQRKNEFKDLDDFIIESYGKTADKVSYGWSDSIGGISSAIDNFASKASNSFDIITNTMGKVGDEAKDLASAIDQAIFGGSKESGQKKFETEAKRKIRDIEREFGFDVEDAMGDESKIEEAKKRRGRAMVRELERQKDNLIDLRDKASEDAKVRVTDIFDPIASATRIADANTASGGINRQLRETERRIAELSKGFAQGGIVGGSGSTDSVNAMLTPGERVLRGTTDRKLMSVLNRIDASLSGGSMGGVSTVNVILNEKVLAKAMLDIERKKKRGML